MVDPSTVDDVDAAHTVLDFWERRRGFRGDGTASAGHRGAPIYDDGVVAQPVEGAAPVDDDARAAVKRFNATLIAYLFLLYFDTRVGAGDTGPYRLPDGRALLVRDYYQLGCSDFWWSDVAEGVLPGPDGGPGARRGQHRPGDGLRHELHETRGLPRPSRRVRLVHDRWGRAGEPRPSRRQPYPRSQRRPPGTIGLSSPWPPWIATRDPLRRTSTSRSCARSRREAGRPTISTGARLATSPVRSTSSCRPWRVTTRVSPTTGRTTSP